MKTVEDAWVPVENTSFVANLLSRHNKGGLCFSRAKPSQNQSGSSKDKPSIVKLTGTFMSYA